MTENVLFVITRTLKMFFTFCSNAYFIIHLDQDTLRIIMLKKPYVFKRVQLFSSNNTNKLCNLGKYFYCATMLRNADELMAQS